MRAAKSPTGEATGLSGRAEGDDTIGKEMTSLQESNITPAVKEAVASACFLKLTLQKLSKEDGTEHLLSTSEQIEKQQQQLVGVWATQLAGFLEGKAIVAYTSLIYENAASYKDVKKAVLHRYDINRESHCRRV